MKDFKFRVNRTAPGTYDYADPTTPEGWSVTLPHQCDEWSIAGEKYEHPPSHEEAVADLTAFIEQAQEALGRLIREESDGERWTDGW